MKLEVIAQTERDTNGPQRTSKKCFPPLSARLTISNCVSDAQICNKSQRENTDGGRGWKTLRVEATQCILQDSVFGH